MIRIYLRQAWAMLRQNRLFSALYIAGTGLAIGMTVVIAMVYYVKIAPIYPETNRMRTLYLTSAKGVSGPETNQWQVQAGVSYKALQEWFYPLKNAVCVSATLSNDLSEHSYVQPADQSGDFPVKVRLTDPAFFRIYEFRFLDGRPFSEADFESGLYAAVITDELARRLFGTTEGVAGRTFTLNYTECRVCGVVRAGSYLAGASYAQIYLPYTVAPGYRKPFVDDLEYIASFRLTFLVEDGRQADALHAEIQDIARRENAMHGDKWTIDFWDQPTTHLLSAFMAYASQEFSVWATVRYFLLLLLVLLLVPALNLSGMISSRMEGRLAEMGVRKSFGAGRGRLLSQVMWENLLLTLLGGAVGLILAWLAVYLSRDWVFSMFDESVTPSGIDVRLTGEMLFAPLVFLSALLFCLLLNLLSALIPAWHSLRKPIVNSLNEKR